MKYILKFEKYTAEEMLMNDDIKKELISGFGDNDEINMWINNFHAKTKNYKDGYYYRADGAGQSAAGVGKGLYLGKDKEAIENFYNIEGIYRIDTYYGKDIKWLDLMMPSDFKKFENKYGKLNNSDKVGEIVKNLGYDGIVYYDPHATGEEFVLFNTEKIKKI